MSTDKLKHWQQSIEIDYLSLYIKTWFAFLTSLKTLYPDVSSPLGDGLLIKHYLDELSLPNSFETDIKHHIKKAHAIGSAIIKRDLPTSFFGRYFSVNKTFRSSIPVDNGHVRFKIEYKGTLNNRKHPNLFIDFRSTQTQFFSKFQVHHFTVNISLTDLISRGFYNDHSECVNYILDSMKDVAYHQIDHLPRLQQAGINQRKAYADTIITLINQQWRPSFRIETLFQPLPVPGFPDAYDETAHKLVVVKWFGRFSYDLRNILFHHIIDPFDEDWLKLFRHTYLALKEMVSHNMQMISDPPE